MDNLKREIEDLAFISRKQRETYKKESPYSRLDGLLQSGQYLASASRSSFLDYLDRVTISTEDPGVEELDQTVWADGIEEYDET